MDQLNKVAFETEYFPGVTVFNPQRTYFVWDANDILSLYGINSSTGLYSEKIFSASVRELTWFRIDSAATVFLVLCINGVKYHIRGFDESITANALDMVGLGNVVRSANGTQGTALQNLGTVASMLIASGVKNKTISIRKIMLITVALTLLLIVGVGVVVVVFEG